MSLIDRSYLDKIKRYDYITDIKIDNSYRKVFSIAAEKRINKQLFIDLINNKSLKKDDIIFFANGFFDSRLELLIGAMLKENIISPLPIQYTFIINKDLNLLSEENLTIEDIYNFYKDDKDLDYLPIYLNNKYDNSYIVANYFIDNYEKAKNPLKIKWS